MKSKKRGRMRQRMARGDPGSQFAGREGKPLVSRLVGIGAVEERARLSRSTVRCDTVRRGEEREVETHKSWSKHQILSAGGGGGAHEGGWNYRLWHVVSQPGQRL